MYPKKAKLGANEKLSRPASREASTVLTESPSSGTGTVTTADTSAASTSTSTRVRPLQPVSPLAATAGSMTGSYHHATQSQHSGAGGYMNGSSNSNNNGPTMAGNGAGGMYGGAMDATPPLPPPPPPLPPPPPPAYGISAPGAYASTHSHHHNGSCNGTNNNNNNNGMNMVGSSGGPGSMSGSVPPAYSYHSSTPSFGSVSRGGGTSNANGNNNNTCGPPPLPPPPPPPPPLPPPPPAMANGHGARPASIGLPSYQPPMCPVSEMPSSPMSRDGYGMMATNSAVVSSGSFQPSHLMVAPSSPFAPNGVVGPGVHGAAPPNVGNLSLCSNHPLGYGGTTNNNAAALPGMPMMSHTFHSYTNSGMEESRMCSGDNSIMELPPPPPPPSYAEHYPEYNAAVMNNTTTTHSGAMAAEMNVYASTTHGPLGMECQNGTAFPPPPPPPPCDVPIESAWHAGPLPQPPSLPPPPPSPQPVSRSSSSALNHSATASVRGANAGFATTAATPMVVESAVQQSEARYLHLYEEFRKLNRSRGKLSDEVERYRREQQPLRDELAYYHDRTLTAAVEKAQLRAQYRGDVALLLSVIDKLAQRVADVQADGDDEGHAKHNPTSEAAHAVPSHAATTVKAEAAVCNGQTSAEGQDGGEVNCSSATHKEAMAQCVKENADDRDDGSGAAQGGDSDGGLRPLLRVLEQTLREVNVELGQGSSGPLEGTTTPATPHDEPHTSDNECTREDSEAARQARLRWLCKTLHLSYAESEGMTQGDLTQTAEGGGLSAAKAASSTSAPTTTTHSSPPLQPAGTTFAMARPPTSAALQDELLGATLRARRELRDCLAAMDYGMPLSSNGMCDLQLELEVHHCHEAVIGQLIAESKRTSEQAMSTTTASAPHTTLSAQ